MLESIIISVLATVIITSFAWITAVSRLLIQLQQDVTNINRTMTPEFIDALKVIRIVLTPDFTSSLITICSNYPKMENNVEKLSERIAALEIKWLPLKS